MTTVDLPLFIEAACALLACVGWAHERRMRLESELNGKRERERARLLVCALNAEMQFNSIAYEGLRREYIALRAGDPTRSTWASKGQLS